MPADATLVGRDLAVEYRSGDYVVRPIDGLDFEAGPGEIVLLLGASGCGKTTLLSVLGGILRPARGSVRVGGAEVTTLDGAALTAYRRHTVGIVFQAFNLIPSLTASENVQVPLRAAGVRPRAAASRASELLEQVGLGDRAARRPADLSGGQQQRVAIARALALDPPLLLADEPTAHLDYIQVESVLEVLREIAGAGRIVVVSTQDERLIPLADRVVAMSPRTLATDERSGTVELTGGDVLFRQGDEGDFVYVVEEGEVEIVRERADGGEETLAHVGTGGYFGELAPVFGLRRSATARAAGPARVEALTPAAFRRRTRGQAPGTRTEGARERDESVAP